MGTLSISMAIFHSKVLVYQRLLEMYLMVVVYFLISLPQMVMSQRHGYIILPISRGFTEKQNGHFHVPF